MTGPRATTTGKVSLLQGTKLSRILRQNPPSVVRAYVEANLEGQQWLRRFCGDHDVPFQERPAYTYAVTSTGEEKARAELAAAELAGLKVTWVDDPELPFDTRGAVCLDDQFQLHPMDLLDAVGRQLMAEGGNVHELSPRALGEPLRHGRGPDHRRGHGHGGHRGAGHQHAHPRPGGFFARLQANGRTPPRSVGLDPARDVPLRGPGHPLPAFGSDRRRGAVARRWQRPCHGTGTGAQPADRRLGRLGHLDLPPQRGHRTPGRPRTTSSLTSLPYVGPLTPGSDDILVATGFDKWGFTNAAAAAVLLSKTVLGHPPAWGTALRSWTSRELAGLPRAVRFNSGVGLQMLNGYLRSPLGHESPAEGVGDVHYEGLHPVAESTVDGQTHRVSAVCTHLRGVLRWNDAERSWDCPLHGSRFGPDGQVLEGPATCPLPRR